MTSSIQQEVSEFWKNREWERYLNGDYCYDLTCEKRANTFLSWITEHQSEMGTKECEKHFLSIFKVSDSIKEEEREGHDEKWHKAVTEVKRLLECCRSVLLTRWTYTVFRLCGTLGNSNEYNFKTDSGSISFWKLSTDKKNKIIFLPGIQVEVTPFLQALRVQTHYSERLDTVVNILREYSTDHLFNQLNQAEKNESSARLNPPIVVTEDKKPKKTKSKKKSTLKKKVLIRATPVEEKPNPKVKRKDSRRKSRSPSLRKEDRIKLTLYTEVSPIWKKPEPVEHATKTLSSHCIDFEMEAFLGPVYHLEALDTGKKPKQCGAWMMCTETNLETHTLNGECLLIALKVPVEEVFLGPGEPIMAFCEKDSNEWKKGVYTTHTQFDQTTFAVKARLSKLGKVALFQQLDFHYPFRRWSLTFEENCVSFHLHTNSVEIKFVIQGPLIHLETQAGDEFSKLRSLHQQKMTISEMASRLYRHGVYIFPNEEALKKQRDTRKCLDVEVHCYSMICLGQLSCQSCRLNGSVSSDTVILTSQGTTMQVETSSSGAFTCTYSSEPASTQEKYTNKLGLGTLFRWLMLIRPISMTK